MKTQEAISTNLKQAQNLTNENLARFELAMDHLANKVDITSHKIQHYRDIASVPKRLYRKLISSITRLTQPIRNEPSPYVVGALGLMAIYSIYLSVNLASKSTSRISSSKRLLLT